MKRTPPGPEFDEHRRVIRARWGHRVTPFRLGMVSGEWLDNLSNPYEPGSLGWKCFADGVKLTRAKAMALRQDLLLWLKRAPVPGVRTSHDCPPIQDRSLDWSAVRDGYEPGCPIGRGPTEHAAIVDLLELEEARNISHKGEETA
jgi:hypothetical protein